MVKFIVGPKGSGKTKWLIERANRTIKKQIGNIVFVDVDDNHIFNLDYSVRLINAMEFNIDNIEGFYGFLCGIIGMDYDVNEVYIDGIYKKFPLHEKELLTLKDSLDIIGAKFNVQFYIGTDLNVDDIPDSLKEDCVKLEID